MLRHSPKDISEDGSQNDITEDRREERSTSYINQLKMLSIVDGETQILSYLFFIPARRPCLVLVVMFVLFG